MRTARAVALLGLTAIAIATLSACGANPPQPATGPTAGPTALLAAARQAQAAPNVAALSTACSRLTAALAAPSVQTTGANTQLQAAIADLNQAQSLCLAIVNTTPPSARASTPTSGLDLTKSMTDLLTSGIGLIKAVTDLLPSKASAASSSTSTSSSTSSSSTSTTLPTLPYTITVHIDDQPLATKDGRVFAPALGNVGLSYMTETYQCADGMVCGGNVFHYAGGMVTLTAGWDNTSKFLGWDGAPCTTANVCRFTLTSNLNITAHFAPATYLLTVHNYDMDKGLAAASQGGLSCGEGFSYCDDLVERANTPLEIQFSGDTWGTTVYDVVLVSGPGCEIDLQAAAPTTATGCSLDTANDTTITVGFAAAGQPNPYRY